MKQQKKLLKYAIREGRRQNKAARRARHEHARAELVERRIDGLSKQLSTKVESFIVTC